MCIVPCPQSFLAHTHSPLHRPTRRDEPRTGRVRRCGFPVVARAVTEDDPYLATSEQRGTAAGEGPDSARRPPNPRGRGSRRDPGAGVDVLVRPLIRPRPNPAPRRARLYTPRSQHTARHGRRSQDLARTHGTLPRPRGPASNIWEYRSLKARLVCRDAVAVRFLTRSRKGRISHQNTSHGNVKVQTPESVPSDTFPAPGCWCQLHARKLSKHLIIRRHSERGFASSLTSI